MPDDIILMVDDTTSLVSPWKAELAKVAKTVQVVGGIEALARLRENPSVRLALVNLSLKRVNGLDAIAKIREKHPQLPILVLADPADRQAVQQAVAYNIQGALPLPVNTAQLMEKIRRFLPAQPAPAGPEPAPQPQRDDTTPSEPLSGIKEKYYEAQSAFANGDLDTAVRLFLEITAEKQLKDSLLKYVEESYYHAGRCYIKKGDYDSAIDILKQFLTKAPKSLLTREALFQLGAAYEMKGDKTKAINFYTKVISLGGTDSLASQARKQIKKLGG